jgi:hypothetical protein
MSTCDCVRVHGLFPIMGSCSGKASPSGTIPQRAVKGFNIEMTDLSAQPLRSMFYEIESLENYSVKERDEPYGC